MNVKRYDVMNYSLDMDGKSGPFVKYEDYAALAAESANKSRCLGFFASVIKSGEEWTSVCQHEYDSAKQTPATDAFMAEVRAHAKADGVQEYADSFRHAASRQRELNGETIRVRALLHEAKNADEFAEMLRKGAQQ